MKSLSIIIPCYNEENNIIPLFEQLNELIKIDQNLEIIIVENGSTDKTLKKIKDHYLFIKQNIVLVTVKKNIGYGHGIMLGIQKSTAKYLSWCHSDLQTNPKFTYYAFKTNFDQLKNNNTIIKGLRKNRILLDNIFTFCMSILVSLIFMIKLTDINAQPKIFSRNLLKFLTNPPNDFSLDLYLLIIAKVNNFKIIDYPVTFSKRIADEAKGAGGGTILNKIKLSLRTIVFTFKLKKNFKNKWK